jgi:hypothetical protein
LYQEKSGIHVGDASKRNPTFFCPEKNVDKIRAERGEAGWLLTVGKRSRLKERKKVVDKDVQKSEEPSIEDGGLITSTQISASLLLA